MNVPANIAIQYEGVLQSVAYRCNPHGLHLMGRGFKRKYTNRLAYHADPLFFVCSRLLPYKYPYLDKLSFALAAHPLMLSGHPTFNAALKEKNRCVPRPTVQCSTPCLYMKRALRTVRESVAKGELRKRIAQDITHWFRQSQPLMAWLKSMQAFRAPVEWPPYIWPKLFKYGVTPFEVAAYPPLFKDSLQYSKNISVLIAWCCGMPEALIAKLLDWREADVVACMICGVNELLSMDKFLLWAANPDTALLGQQYIHSIKSIGKWEQVSAGNFPPSKNLRQLGDFSYIIDPTERYNVIAWTSLEPIIFEEE